MLDSNEYKSDSTLAQHCREMDKAIGDYTKAIELNPSEASAYVKHGLAYHAKDEFGRAVADFTKAIELGDDSAYLERGSVYRKIRTIRIIPFLQSQGCYAGQTRPLSPTSVSPSHATCHIL